MAKRTPTDKPSSMEGIVAGFRMDETDLTSVHLAKDHELAKFCAAWTVVPFVVEFPPTDPPDVQWWWDWAWDAVQPDFVSLRMAMGVEEHVAEKLFQRAKALRLIYPDGTITAKAREMIEAEIPGGGEGDVSDSQPVSIRDLDLCVRTSNCFRLEGITTVGELLSWTERDLLALRRFGKSGAAELKERLAHFGLKLRAVAT